MLYIGRNDTLIFSFIDDLKQENVKQVLNAKKTILNILESLKFSLYEGKPSAVYMKENTYNSYLLFGKDFQFVIENNGENYSRIDLSLKEFVKNLVEDIEKKK